MSEDWQISPTGRSVTRDTPLNDDEINDLEEYLRTRVPMYGRKSLPANAVHFNYARLLATVNAAGAALSTITSPSATTAETRRI